MQQPIDHFQLSDMLERCGSSWNAGQVHGLLCSRLTTSGSDGATKWFAQVLEETDANNALRAECKTMLDNLCAVTWRQLVERQSEFTLLLPDDQDSAALRATAMGQWCEGYLHGLVSEKHSDDLNKQLAAEPMADIIKDMLQITRATVAENENENEDEGEDEDKEEGAFSELVEYLRVAVQLAYEELADFREPDEDSPANDSDTLH